MTTSTLALVERAHDSLLVGYAAESATARHHAAQSQPAMKVADH